MATPTGSESKSIAQLAGLVSDAVAPVQPVPENPELIQLPPGTVLTEAEAQELAANRSVRIIVIAGAVDCGETRANENSRADEAPDLCAVKAFRENKAFRVTRDLAVSGQADVSSPASSP